MLRTFAVLFGVFMLVFGTMGFIPMVKEGDFLFKIFHVNFFLNLTYIGTGFISLLCGLNNTAAARLFFQAFGIFFGLLTILGIYYGSEPVFGLLANNWADTLLHLGIALLSIYLGFRVKFRAV